MLTETYKMLSKAEGITGPTFPQRWGAVWLDRWLWGGGIKWAAAYRKSLRDLR